MTRGPILVLASLVTINAMAWVWAVMAFTDHPALLGTALLAWVFGLRHAADADHLAAIDNVVRKLMQDGQRPCLAGLYFSLGHSSVVMLACALIAAMPSGAVINPLRNLGGVIGTVTSAGFLMTIAAANLNVLVHLGRSGVSAEEQDQLLTGRGLLARILRPATRLIRRPAHMLPLGFLFGLGFDTATEIGLLALSAAQAASGLSLVQVLIFPSLFTAGMAVIDTADSVLMVGAYGWALTDPQRKLTYNRVVTGISVALALGIGGTEVAGLLSDRLALAGWFWRFVAAVNDASGQIGFAVIAVFIAVWAGSALLHRHRAPIATPPPASD